MKIIDHPSIIAKSSVVFDESTAPTRIVLRVGVRADEHSTPSYIVHNERLRWGLEVLELPAIGRPGPDLVWSHDGFDNGDYFAWSALARAQARFIERCKARNA